MVAVPAPTIALNIIPSCVAMAKSVAPRLEYHNERKYIFIFNDNISPIVMLL